VNGAFTCTLASGVAVEASLVMKFLDSDAKAFPYRTGKEHLLCVTGYFQFEILGSHKRGYVGPDGRYSIQARYDFVSPFPEERAVVKIGDLSGIIDSEGK